MGKADAFKVGDLSVSCTKDCTKQELIHDTMSLKLAVVDTIGIGDTDLDKPAVLQKIAKVVKEFPEGVHGIFFVFDGRFTEAERTAYALITRILFPKCERNLYLVRNKFRHCQDVKMCQTDINELNKDEGTKGVFSLTPAEHIIHVDSNPDVQARADYTKDILMTIINKLDATYAAPEYKEIYDRIKDANDQESGKIVESLTEVRLSKMSGLEVLGLGLGKTANDLKGVLVAHKCAIM
jgi:hypothetical protein